MRLPPTSGGHLDQRGGWPAEDISFRMLPPHVSRSHQSQDARRLPAGASRFSPTLSAGTVASRDARRLPAGVSRSRPTPESVAAHLAARWHAGATCQRQKVALSPATTAISTACLVSKSLNLAPFRACPRGAQDSQANRDDLFIFDPHELVSCGEADSAAIAVSLDAKHVANRPHPACLDGESGGQLDADVATSCFSVLATADPLDY